MKTQNGFSLIEIIVTLSIAAVLLSLGVPAFQSYTQNSRQTTVINELASALQLARNGAITRRARVTLCKSANGQDCVSDGAASDWTQGWMIFADSNSNNTRDSGEDILRVHGAVQGNVTLSGGTAAANRVSFDPRGLLASGNGTITYCDSRGNSSASALVFSRAGQVRFENDGSTLTC